MTTPAFDLLAAWRRLPPDLQERAGAAALAHALGLRGAMEDTPWETAFCAAQEAGSAVLERLIEEHLVPRGEPLPRPDLSALGVRACRACGCTDGCGCPEGCEWVGPVGRSELRPLCSSCADSCDGGTG